MNGGKAGGFYRRADDIPIIRPPSDSFLVSKPLFRKRRIGLCMHALEGRASAGFKGAMIVQDRPRLFRALQGETVRP